MVLWGLTYYRKITSWLTGGYHTPHIRAANSKAYRNVTCKTDGETGWRGLSVQLISRAQTGTLWEQKSQVASFSDFSGEAANKIYISKVLILKC